MTGFMRYVQTCLDDDVADILKVMKEDGRLEDCFQNYETDFEARPVYLNREDWIKPISYLLSCSVTFSIIKSL